MSCISNELGDMGFSYGEMLVCECFGVLSQSLLLQGMCCCSLNVGASNNFEMAVVRNNAILYHNLKISSLNILTSGARALGIRELDKVLFNNLNSQHWNFISFGCHDNRWRMRKSWSQDTRQLCSAVQVFPVAFTQPRQYHFIIWLKTAF